MFTAEQQKWVDGYTSTILKLSREFPRGVFSDVVAWAEKPYGRDGNQDLYIGMVGNGEKIAKLFGFRTDDPGDFGVKGIWIANALKRVGGLDNSGFKDIGMHGVHISEFLDRMKNTAFGWDGRKMPFADVTFRFIVDPGHPWPASDEVEKRYNDWIGGFSYWSAKKHKQVAPAKPTWFIDVEDPDRYTGTMRGVNPCAAFPPNDTRSDVNGPVAGTIKGQLITLTHCVRNDVSDDSIEKVRSCGGLLFPSLAVGPIPATNFGTIVFVFPLEMALRSLKPYRRRGVRPTWVYNTDAWTAQTGELTRSVPEFLFEELHGHRGFYEGSHMWTLGPPRVPTSNAPVDTRVLESTAQLGAAAKKISRLWKRDIAEAKFAQLSKVEGTEDFASKYAYCEAKATEVVAVNDLPYIVAPMKLRASVERMVNGLGYDGEVLLIKDDFDLDSPYERYKWAWRVSDIIKGLRKVEEVRT